MVSNSGQEPAQEDQMKLTNIKKTLFCQMSHLKTLCQLGALSEVVYHFYKSYKLFTQYTSYEVPYIAKSSTPK